MGCDIHQRTFVWSRSVKHYVAVGELSDVDDTDFRLVRDRYYDLFGLFGNTVRSCYPALDNLNFGLPDSLPKTAKMSFKHYGTDFHTISWILLPDLYASLTKYVDKLKNPAKFLVDNPESFTESMFELPEWKDDTTTLISIVSLMLENVKYLVQDRDFEKIIDPDKTMFLFYFDN